MRTCIVDNSTRRSAISKEWRMTSRLWPSYLLVGVVFSLVLFGPMAADAQYLQMAPGISVEGTGEARTIPDVVEINLRLVAKGELTDDAVVKHRDARKRTLETFQALKIDNLKLEEKDLTLRPGNSQEMMQMMMWGGMPASNNKRTQIEVASMLRARLTDVSKIPTEELMSTIGKLLDAAQDSGAGLGVSDSDMMMRRWNGWGRQTPLVKFVVTNLAEIREKAYDVAVADARKRAERLARLNGVKLGAISAIEESDSTSRGQNYPYYMAFDNDDTDENHAELIANTLSGGRISIRLRVRFAIDGPADSTDAKATAKGKSP